MMKKRIVSILCIIALLATMLSVGIITATASGTATMSLGIVDDEGNAVTEMQPGDKAWMAFTLSDYAAAMGDTSIAVIQAFADINTDKFEVVEEAGKAKWATPYTNIVSGGVFTSNVADKVFGAIIETDTNAGATYSISKADLDANNGLLFKVQIAAKSDAAAGTEEFKLKATSNTASTSIAFANATAPTLNCDTAAATVEIKSTSSEGTVVNLLPTTDASKWTGNVEYIKAEETVIGGVTCTPAGSFVLRDNKNEPKQITTVDTIDLGDNFKVSGTLAGTKFRRADDFYAYAYAQVGDFKFVIGDERDETDANRPKVMFVRAYMGEELVYEERIMQGNTLGLNIFDQVNFNATIDNNAKTVTLDYTKGAIGALETINGTGTYTGDYSFDAVTATAAAQNNFVATDDAVNVAVAGLSVEKLAGGTSSDDTSSDIVVETTTNLVPITDASKWTGNTEYIKAEETVIGGVTCTPAGSFVLRDNKNEPKQITTVDTIDLGDNFKVSGTLIGNKFRRADDFYAYAYAQVGDFKFVIGDERDETDANRPKVMYVRAYMGEELVYEERIMQGNTLGLNIFDQVNFNATIDNNAKTVTLDYTKGAIGALETINGTGTYTGDYSFDAVTATAAAQNNFVATDDAVNVAVAGLSVEKLAGGTSSDATSSDDTSSDDVSSDDTSSDDTSSETPTEKLTNLLPTTDASKWTGATEFIAANDVTLNNYVYAPAGSLVVNANTASAKEITTVDTFDFGDKLKVSGTLVSYEMVNDLAVVYSKVGDFKFEISNAKDASGVSTLYVKAYMGEEVVYEKSWPKEGNGHIFRQVRFNATIDTTAKTVELDYTTGWVNTPDNNTGSGTYTGNYSFDDVTVTASAKNCWLNGADKVNVAVAKLLVEKLDDVASSEETSSEDASSDDTSSDDVSSDDTSSDDVSSDDVSSEDTSSDDVSSEPVPELPTSAVLLPDTDTTKWTGDTINIKLSDSTVGGNVLAPAGSFVEDSNTNSPLEITTVDSYNLGNYFKVSGTLVANLFRKSDDFYAFASAKAGDFTFVVGDSRDKYDDKILYVRAYMGEELVYEKTWPQIDLGTGVLDQVKFNAVINNTAKTVTLDYTTGKFDSLTKNTGSGKYTGDYSFDSVTATATVQNNWVTPSSYDVVNVAVAGLSIENLGEAPSDGTSSGTTSDTSSDVSPYLPAGQYPLNETDTYWTILEDESYKKSSTNDSGFWHFMNTKGDWINGSKLYEVVRLDNIDATNGFKFSTSFAAGKINLNDNIRVVAQFGDVKVTLFLNSCTATVENGETVLVDKATLFENEFKDYQMSVLGLPNDYYAAQQRVDTWSGPCYTIEMEYKDGKLAVNIINPLNGRLLQTIYNDLQTIDVVGKSASVSRYFAWQATDVFNTSFEVYGAPSTETNKGEKLEVSIDQESFKEEDWTGDTAKGEHIHNPGKENEVVTYHGIVDGEFLCPSNSSEVTIESVKTWDLSGGFNASIDTAFLGNWNFNEIRTLAFSVGPATVTFTNARNTANKNEPPEEFYATLSINGVELGTGTMLFAPDGIVGIKFDAQTNMLSATFFDSPIKLTPKAGGEQVDGIDISAYMTPETFTNDGLKIYQKGCWAIDRKVSTYSLSTPDSATPEAPPSSSEDTSSEPESSSTPESSEPESSSTPESSKPSSSAPSSSAPSSSAPSSSAPSSSTPNGGGNGGTTNSGGTSSKTGETVEYYYYLDQGTYGTATGDSSNVLAAIIVLLAASGVAAGLIISRKRKSNSEK